MIESGAAIYWGSLAAITSPVAFAWSRAIEQRKTVDKRAFAALILVSVSIVCLFLVVRSYAIIGPPRSGHGFIIIFLNISANVTSIAIATAARAKFNVATAIVALLLAAIWGCVFVAHLIADTF
jgi:hypothetical protein